MTYRFGILLIASLCASCGRESDTFEPDAIVTLERAALDRWGKGDPQGFFDIMAPDQTYFDPVTAKRVDGQDALKRFMAPFWGRIFIDHVDMIDPKVQRVGDLAVLTFNLVDSGARIGSGPKTTVRWNATEVFRRVNGTWKIIHSHWSHTKPVIKEPTMSQLVESKAACPERTRVL